MYQCPRCHGKGCSACDHSGKVAHLYSREAVDNAIASSNRAGRRIGKREARLIHALLKGRE